MTMKTIDLLTPWQNTTEVGLGEVIFTEKTAGGEAVSVLIMSTNQFDLLIHAHRENFRKLEKTSLVYRYFDRKYAGENQDWAVDAMMKVENVPEWISHLEQAYAGDESLTSLQKEYEATIAFCTKAVNHESELYFIADQY